MFDGALFDKRHTILQFSRYTHRAMKGEIGERWRWLCEQAAVEQDSEKLLELTKEIVRLLDEKERRLKGARKPQQDSVV
jgi:hypothetical protein